MALVIAPENIKKFIAFADEENLEATVIGQVSDNRRLVMYWRGDKIVDLSRDFLNTNGVAQHADVKFAMLKANAYLTNCRQKLLRQTV